MIDAMTEYHPAWAGLARVGRHGRQDGAPGVICTPSHGAGIALVSARLGDREALAASVRAELDLDLPRGPCASEAIGGMQLIGIGPGRWLAVAYPSPPEGIEAMLVRETSGRAAVVDQSHGLAVMTLSGPAVHETLAKGTGVDLHPRAFTANQAATTAIAHMTVHLWQVDPAVTFALAVPQSLVGSFWSWLVAAAAPYGLEVRASPARP